MSHESLDFHTLTERDIRRYVATGLDRYEDITDFKLRGEEKQHLVKNIVDASEGVFLWAVLVTTRLCKSIEIGDTFHQLCEQLNEVPYDMTQLFHDILQRTAYDFFQEAAAQHFLDGRVHLVSQICSLSPSMAFVGMVTAYVVASTDCMSRLGRYGRDMQRQAKQSTRNSMYV
ncbi:hypothetical protein GGR57DRAFT_416745 [Xylariaceae sp. FL1272]|nr:hypothetical protein GGR57DRAFT_416745 [Xylariaceae sp. FL1272]